jgi:hypothetical protein
VPHLCRDWAHPSHIRAGTGLTPATSAPALGSPLSLPRRDWAHPSHIRAGTGLTAATSAPGTGLIPATSAPGPATAAQLLTVWRADQVAQDDAVPFLAPPLCACACVISLCGARGKPPLCPALSPQSRRRARQRATGSSWRWCRNGVKEGKHRSFVFSAATRNEADAWITAISSEVPRECPTLALRPRGACVRVRTGTGRMLRALRPRSPGPVTAGAYYKRGL